MTVRDLLSAVATMISVDGAAALGGQSVLLDQVCPGVTSDSRKVVKGSVFVALQGLTFDGTQFVGAAIAAGAAAIVSERPSVTPGTVWLQVPNARMALAFLADTFYGSPSRQLKVVGITGTNGKTTTSFLVRAILEAAGVRCGLMGTVGHSVGGREVAATRTTPEAVDVQELMREMVQSGCGACVMEVSSHALALHRVDGVRFAAAVFTNLTRDHLDFHGDMDAYFGAKRRLFEMLPAEAPGVVNIDDPRGATLAGIASRTVTYGINRPADISPGPLSFTVEGLTFDVRTPQGVVHVRSKLVGKVNVYNILASIGTALALDVSIEAIERGLAGLRGVPGRFEVVSSPSDGIAVIVDYAHTDDALRNLLETARSLAPRRLITVFGAGGGRDRTKRPLMGMVAARLSDLVVITSDNPRSEDPERIIHEVRLGADPETKRGGHVETVVDRAAAISFAIRQASAGDMVLIAGKGHEKSQEIGGRLLPFDDVAVAREALDARRMKAQAG